MYEETAPINVKKNKNRFLNIMYDFVAVIAIIALLLLIIFSVYSYQSENTISSKTGNHFYINQSFGFTFEYPPNYLIEEGYYSVKVIDPDTKNYLLVKYAELEGNTENQSNINLRGYLRLGSVNMRCIEITKLQVEYSDEYLIKHDKIEQNSENEHFKSIIDSIKIPECKSF